jgi:hypothetical protein
LEHLVVLECNNTLKEEMEREKGRREAEKEEGREGKRK